MWNVRMMWMIIVYGRSPLCNINAYIRCEFAGMSGDRVECYSSLLEGSYIAGSTHCDGAGLRSIEFLLYFTYRWRHVNIAHHHWCGAAAIGSSKCSNCSEAANAVEEAAEILKNRRCKWWGTDVDYSHFVWGCGKTEPEQENSSGLMVMLLPDESNDHMLTENSLCLLLLRKMSWLCTVKTCFPSITCVLCSRLWKNNCVYN